MITLAQNEDRTGEASIAAVAFASVEPATYEDAFGILETMKLAHAESVTPYPELDMPYAVQATLDLIAQGLVAVARGPSRSRIVGCLMLDVARWPWTHPNNPKGLHLYNQHFWIEPRYRRGGVARDFLRFAKALSDERQVPLVIDISSMSDDAELRDRFVRISGFAYTGGKFFRAPKPKL